MGTRRLGWWVWFHCISIDRAAIERAISPHPCPLGGEEGLHLIPELLRGSSSGTLHSWWVFSVIRGWRPECARAAGWTDLHTDQPGPVGHKYPVCLGPSCRPHERKNQPGVGKSTPITGSEWGGPTAKQKLGAHWERLSEGNPQCLSHRMCEGDGGREKLVEKY